MDTVKARSAVGLALAIGLALPSCTNTEGPQVSSTPRATTADTRAANDDPAATEAALERFIGMDASDAKRKLLRQHFEIRFGSAITLGERNNIRGNQTHPDVVIEGLELGSNEVVIISEVSCAPRAIEGSGNYC